MSKELFYRRTLTGGVLALIIVVAFAFFVRWRIKANPRTTPSDCTKLCNAYNKLEKARSENIDLKARVAELEEELKDTNPPNSRHFYDCTPSKADDMWTLAIHSYTMSKIWTYRCMSHKGHTSLDRQIPDEKRKIITCTDQRGAGYPQ